MNLPPDPPRSAATDAALAAAFARCLGNGREPAGITAFSRRPFLYATSAPLDELDVRLGDGARIEAIFKDLNPHALAPGAARVRPEAFLDPRREIEAYRSIVAPFGLGARFYGGHVDEPAGVFWLFLERLAGSPISEVGELDVWVDVGRWLAAMHDRLGRLDLEALARAARLIRYDRAFYRFWHDRARSVFAGDAPRSRLSRAALEWLLDRHDRVVERLLAMPPTVIHGECYASNVVVVRNHGLRICPVDWEMAAIAPGLVDLAAFTLGEWREEDRRQVIAAYAAARPDLAAAAPAEVVDAVDCCQIHLAVQWLGWFGRRRPPAAHARDWLAEAVGRAERLGL